MYMSPEEIKAYRPFSPVKPSTDGGPVGRSRKRMEEVGVWAPNQVLGRRYAIGCVALEITQRCNLDCTLCYLSEHSEDTKDIPLEEIFRRIEMIRFHFGKGTDVQITGGDPTLRKKEELLAIIRRIREVGLCPTLMTNGILATRPYMTALVEAGLRDVAFHVDMTQERKGFKSEMEMNSIRERYIENVRGLKVAVIFNTTVFDGNFHEVPDLIRFFRKHSDVVGMASFQMQADTGRGVLHERDHQLITLESMKKQIEAGTGKPLSFDTVRIGHPSCHKYALTLQAGGETFDFYDDTPFFSLLIEKSKHLDLDRTRPLRACVDMAKWLLSNPALWIHGIPFVARQLWRMKGAILRSRGKVYKLSFFMQNFMDAQKLEADRVHACSFMTITADGPVSMCMHNAKRDEYILNKLKLDSAPGQVWNPLTGKLEVVA